MELRKVLFQKEKKKGRKAGVAFSWGFICMEYEEHCVLSTGALVGVGFICIEVWTEFRRVVLAERLPLFSEGFCLFVLHGRSGFN